MDIQNETVSEFKAGQLAVTATPQSLPGFRAAKGVTLKNLGVQPVLLGGYFLEAGQKVSIPVDRGEKVTLQTASGSSTVCYLIS
jgi:hypothetical protein